MHIARAQIHLPWWKRIILNLTIASAYVLFGNIGMLFSSYGGSSSPLWPPSGMALAMVLIFGIPQVIPGIIVGVFMLALQGHAPVVTILGLIGSNLLECIMASMLLHSVSKGRFRFASPRDILAFLMIAVMLSPFVSSTVGITFLYIGEMVMVSNVPHVWSTLFFGNALGILVFTPLILSFFTKRERKYSALESLSLYSSLIMCSFWAFDGGDVRKFVLLPFLTWAALRFSFRGVSISTLIVGFVWVWRSPVMWDVFGNVSTEDDLLWIQCMTAGIVVVGYFMSTAMEAQEVANENKKHKRIAEDALAILDQTIHQSTIGFALVDKSFRFIRINDAMAVHNEMSASEHLGKTIKDVSPETSEMIENLINRVFTTGVPIMNYPFKGKAVGLLSCYPIRNPLDGNIFSVAINFQDMSEEIKTQNLLIENQDRLAFAQEAGKIGAFEWDGKTGEIIWTQELEHIYRLNNGEFGGSVNSWAKWIHPDDLKITKEAVIKVISGEAELNLEFRIINNANETRWLLARGRMIKDEDGRNIKFIGINIDLTEQKNIEQKLRHTEASLLHALSVRDEFMATASHELKTPLTSLKLQTQLFQRRIGKNVPEIYSSQKVHDLLEKNSRQIDRLNRLVDDMLDISRIRTGKLSLKKEPCELGLILEEILARTHEQRVASGTQILVEHLEEARGEWDPLRIEQVITNMITNAIRYGNGKPVTIAIKNYQESVRITVKDQGMGIPKADLKKIFNRYERGLVAREVSGLGLGLFITQQIVEAHGGKIWVESEIHEGSTFFVDLPRSSLPIILTPESVSFNHVEC